MRVMGVLTAVVLVAVLGVAPQASAEVQCTTIYEVPGATVTVAGNPVRVPQQRLRLCTRDTTDPAALIPSLEVDTREAQGCVGTCFALTLHHGNSFSGEVVLVHDLEYEETEYSVFIPQVLSAGQPCLFGYGSPNPPVWGCLVSVAPDG